MKEDNLPVDDHIVRYVKPSMILEDGTASGNGFCLRKMRAAYLSTGLKHLEVIGIIN
ncbi:MAG: hypothetical protein OXF60_12115 [Gammaproteobacteria bacterium]|nr:hypothetical protein [Gammaproteobacteria bacterium]MCY4219604.1 hypothetical protein [Gammaproteobacteria bacterium]